MIWSLVGLVVVGLFLSGFFSGAETGLYCVNRLRVELGAQRGDPQAIRIAQLLADEHGSLSTTLIGTNLMNYATTTAVAFLLADVLGLGETTTEVYTVLALTPVVFVFGEVVPKNLFQRYADQLLQRGSLLLSITDRAFRLTGLIWLLKQLATAVNRIINGEGGTDTRLAPKWRVAHLLREALAGDEVADDRLDLIRRVCGLSETPIHAVMVPRNRVRVISAQADRRELHRVARKTSHTRVCVYEGRQRHIVGVIDIDELLRDSTWTHVHEKLQRAPELSPHDTVASALTQLQRSDAELAVVDDSAGRMVGIVTFTDLLRELVGELNA